MDSKSATSTAARTEPPTCSYTIHSQANMLEPLISEGHGLAHKSKRKRTSAEDHAILEAAYHSNSKPGKDERASLVDSVNMTEKEVQIWFQNRRQNDRRRSKPLQPHELIAHIANISTPQTITPASSQQMSVEHAEIAPRTAETPPSSLTPPSESTDTLPSSSSDAARPRTSVEQHAKHDRISHNEPISRVSVGDAGQGRMQEESGSTASTLPAGNPPISSPNSLASSGRKRSYEEMAQIPQPSNTTVSAPHQTLHVVSEQVPSKTKEPLKRSTSVRLSMTVDGAVKVKTTDDLTPSPEKDRSLPPGFTDAGRRRTLSRSQSMIEESNVPCKGARPTGVFGRSRDHRKWEFYCDNASGQALSVQAEAERSGSAIGAINLIRSNSMKGRALAASPTPLQGNLKSKDGRNRSQFSRVKSSIARVNTQTEQSSKKTTAPIKHVRTGSDSDKENWAPGTRLSQNALRRTYASTNSRAVLQDNEGVIFPDASTSHAHPKNDKISPSKSKARGEDLDCIQGLLSLSQGAWR